MNDERQYPPEFTHDVWMGTLEFLTYNAPLAWAEMMGRGVRFVMPPQVAARPRV